MIDAAPDTWPSNNISARFYGFAPDGQVTWEERIPDGGASGSALESGLGDAFAYNADHSVAAFDSLFYINDAPQNAQGDSSPVVGPPAAGAYGATYGLRRQRQPQNVRRERRHHQLRR